MKLLIKNARLVDEEKDFIGDIYIEEGKIKDFGEALNYESEIIDGDGFVVMPSFIDLHFHLRDPGFTEKEDVVSAGKASLKGGYTLVNAMGNTNPPASNMEIVEYVLDKSEKANLIDIHQTVTITDKFDGKTLNHLDEIDDRVKFISDDGKGVKSSLTMYNAMVKAKELGFIVMVHAEDEDLTPIDYRISENIETIRDIYLAKETGAHLHLSHVSTKEAIEEIRRAKREGVNLTCEVTPHHISLWDNDYRVNPPIREKEDVDAIIEAIIDGTVDAIATDHAPHTKKDKENGSPGLSGIETSFSICYSSLVKSGKIDLKKLSKVMSANPAEIFGLKKGRIEKGYDADLVLLDLDKEIKVNGDEFISKGKNTPFNGMKFNGEVEMTIKAGQVKYKR